MRTVLAVVGSVVVVVAAIGVAGHLGQAPAAPSAKQRSAARPAAPAAAPRPASDTVEAAPLAATPGSRLETRRLLVAHEFQKVTDLMEAKQLRAAMDVRDEDELTRMILTFNVADEAMGRLLDDWVAAQPHAWPPHLARSEHFVAVGFARRGGKWRDETSRKQMVGFDEYLRRAREEAHAALQANPKSIEAYGVLIRIAMAEGKQDDCLTLADQALRIEPDSARIRFSLAYCLRPRWGGSYKAIEAIADEAQDHSAKNPRLSALGGFVAWDRATLLDDKDEAEEAIALYGEALKAGEYYEYYEDRARALKLRKRNSDALADLANALALRPEEPDVLALRVRVLGALGRHRDALTDVRLIAEIDPENDGLAWIRSNETKNAVARARDLLEVNDADSAIERLTIGMQIAGENALLLFWRGRAYMKRQQFDRALADMEASIHLDPRFIESYHNVDWLLAREGRWDEIIGHWTGYLALEPQSGEGFLERAGAHLHKGDRDAFLADARQACALGVQKGCSVAPRARN